MTVYLNKVTRLIDSVSEWTGRIFIWLIVPLTLLSVFEIIMRRFFGSPTIWSFEVITQTYGIYFMIVASYGLLHKSHVAIDIVTMHMFEAKRAVLDLIGYFVFFFPFTIVCFWKSFLYALESWSMWETSWSAFAPPLYPIKSFMALAFLLLIIQGISEVIKKCIIIKGVAS
ncbi:MAG: TRAP transporter small permease subunit [Syntrophales bacterium]|jgi:TRAP-type mannitol/chloroaromatic compound transport system permease small subunit|nr:TRAP transporter small permease subunit [Syntrophales bacterium]MDX9921996.1 TRAP transporter small permease subunit [Syntrophales bacterium]